MSEAPDATLVTRFLERADEEAFRALFRRHAGAMQGLAARLLAGRGSDAEDAVQEAWVRAARRLSTFAWRSSLRTWLLGFTVRCCWELLRERPDASLSGEPLPGLLGPDGDPARRLDLERALAALPAGYRAVLVLHDVEGWTHQEIAAQLGIEPGTSKSQLARARHRLRERWRAEEPNERRGAP